MWARLSIVAGLVAGIAVAALVLGGILALAPDPLPASTPVPTSPIATSSPTPTEIATSSPSPTASAVPSASAADVSLHIGGPALPLSDPAAALGKILPGVDGKP